MAVFCSFGNRHIERQQIPVNETPTKAPIKVRVMHHKGCV